MANTNNLVALNNSLIIFGRIMIVGQATTSNNKEFIVVKDVGSPENEDVLIPMEFLASGQTSQLDKLFIKNKLYALLAEKPKKVREELLRVLQKTDLKHLIISEGYQTILCDGIECDVFAKNGVCYSADKSISAEKFYLSDRAAEKVFSDKTIEDFKQDFYEPLAKLDRFLVILVVAIAAHFFHAFNIARLAFFLVGRTSCGKSTIQRFASYLINGKNTLRDFNATSIGMHDYCVAQGSLPIFLEDAHKAGQATLDLIMESGNGSGRFRSTYGKNGEDDKHKKMTGVPIVSSEMSIHNIAKRYRLVLDKGVDGRSIGIYETNYGAFEDLCGFKSGAKLSEYLDEQAPKYAGVLGDAAISEIAENLNTHKKSWEKRKDTIRKKIISSAQLEDNFDGVDARVLNGLVFCAFIGRQLSVAGVLPVSRNRIYEAFGTVFKGRVDYFASQVNLSDSERPTLTEKAVQTMIAKNQKKFFPVNQKLHDGSKKCMGFTKQCKKTGDILYLIEPYRFKSILGDKFHDKTFADLRAADYLVTSRARGYHYQQRVGEELKDFIAIRAAILEPESR